ncbi:hypothetical protein D3C75_883180 [compost metagenome]
MQGYDIVQPLLELVGAGIDQEGYPSVLCPGSRCLKNVPLIEAACIINPFHTEFNGFAVDFRSQGIPHTDVQPVAEVRRNQHLIRRTCENIRALQNLVRHLILIRLQPG